MVGKNKNELGEQTNVIKSIRSIGGYGRKISHRFHIGIPDLLLVVPNFVPGIWEMKDFGPWEKDTERQTNVSDKQEIELTEFNNACYITGVGRNERASGVLITYRMAGARYLTICPNGTTTLRKKHWPTIVRQTGAYYDMVRLFDEFKVAKWQIL